MTPNQSMHRTRYSGLRPLARSGDLERWAYRMVNAAPRAGARLTAAVMRHRPPASLPSGYYQPEVRRLVAESLAAILTSLEGDI